MREVQQIFEGVDLGLVIIDRELIVRAWNRWMEQNTGVAAADIVGRVVLERFPNLANPTYSRFLGSVLTFGNYAYFSQKLHKYLFPIPNPHPSAGKIPLMQQSCSAGPIRDESGAISSVFITVQDVTEHVSYELALKERVTELQAAMKKIKQLEGIIPICAYCKKIRDDRQSWHQLERYMADHSEAQFSHGICPDCLSKEAWKTHVR
jgi:hypothetical protein